MSNKKLKVSTNKKVKLATNTKIAIQGTQIPLQGWGVPQMDEYNES